MRSISQIVPLAAVAVLATGAQSQIFRQNTAYPTRPFGSAFSIPAVNATYDYIVVGGGTAGLTVASRLVEQNAGTVAIIEAGTFYEMYGNTSQVPAYAATWIGKSPEDSNPAADWDYVTTPQAGANNLTMHYPRGKMFGGSSARNFMIYQRATTGSFDRWAEQVGDDSYTLENLMPFFEKSLNFTPPDQSKRAANATPSWDESKLGTSDGPVSLTFPNWAYAFGSWATRAFTQIGISLLPQGFNNGEILGQAYGMFTLSRASMIRESSETAFLQSSLGHPDYYIYPLTMAKKIVFDDSLTATGVIVKSFDTEFHLSAHREIILAAGVVGSPQLLQVSGVGPAELLEPLGIPVIADRPGVGQGMEDHIVFGISHGVNVVTSSQLGDPAFFVEQRRLFNEEASGLLTNPGADVIAFEKLPKKTRGAFSNGTRAALAQVPYDWPEVEYIGFSSYLGDANVLADPADGTSYATLSVVLVAPQSKGSVNITSADASVPPAINPAYLTACADEEVAVGGFKRAREFWAASSLDDLRVGPEAYPGADVVSDAQILSAIRKSLQTLYHGSCTCAMGRADDPRAVIDSEARVYGVQGLRVVDASSFPSLPPGHPQSVIYALAEKIACDLTSNCS